MLHQVADELTDEQIVTVNRWVLDRFAPKLTAQPELTEATRAVITAAHTPADRSTLQALCTTLHTQVRAYCDDHALDGGAGPTSSHLYTADTMVRFAATVIAGTTTGQDRLATLASCSHMADLHDDLWQLLVEVRGDPEPQRSLWLSLVDTFPGTPTELDAACAHLTA